MHAEKALGRARRLEALHFVLSSSHRLMRIFGSAVLPEPLYRYSIFGAWETLGSARAWHIMKDGVFYKKLP